MSTIESQTPAQPPTEAELFTRLLDQPGMSRELAESILEMKFRQTDVERMHQLAEKARRGNFSDEERLETERYDRVGAFVSMLKSRARVTLNANPSGQ
ncbi:MAG: hypothetical protein R3C59_09835 [Planctomycetaceae bacterium]